MQTYRGRRIRTLPFTDSLLQWPQCLLIWSLETWDSPKCPVWVQGSRDWSHPLLNSRPWAGDVSEMEQPAQESVPMRDVGTRRWLIYTSIMWGYVFDLKNKKVFTVDIFLSSFLGLISSLVLPWSQHILCMVTFFLFYF